MGTAAAGRLPKVNRFLLLNLVAVGLLSVAWTVQNVRTALYHRHADPAAHPIGLAELLDEVDVTVVLILCIFSFAPQLFSLCLCFLFTFFAEHRQNALMARASAVAATWVFGPLAWCIFNSMQVIQGLSHDASTIRSRMCGPEGDEHYCSFVKTSSRLSLAMLVPQALLLLYNLVLYAVALRRQWAGARRRAPALDGGQRLTLAVLVLGALGYATWAAGSVGTFSLHTINVDIIRMLMMPFLAISVFLTLVFGAMLAYEPSAEMAVLVGGFSGLGVFGFAGGIVYHWRRLRNEDYAIFGVTPCRPANAYLVELVLDLLHLGDFRQGADDSRLCAWEEASTVGITVCLAFQVLMAAVAASQLLWRRRWVTLSFGAPAAAGFAADGSTADRPLLAPTSEEGAAGAVAGASAPDYGAFSS